MHARISDGGKEKDEIIDKWIYLKLLCKNIFL